METTVERTTTLVIIKTKEECTRTEGEDIMTTKVADTVEVEEAIREAIGTTMGDTTNSITAPTTEVELCVDALVGDTTTITGTDHKGTTGACLSKSIIQGLLSIKGYYLSKRWQLLLGTQWFFFLQSKGFGLYSFAVF